MSRHSNVERGRASSIVIGVISAIAATAAAGCSGSDALDSLGPGPALVDAGAGDEASAAAPDAGAGSIEGGLPPEHDATVPPVTDATTGDAADGASNADLITRLLQLTKTCPKSAVVSAHSYSENNGSPVDVCKLDGAVYYTAKMAIDCDGRTTTHCPGSGADKDCCYFDDTSFHNTKGEPLAAELDRYVVLPLDFQYPGLDQNSGGNVIAVIYKGQLEFAVFGDQGPTDKIGEASYRTASTLGINPSPAVGGVDGDVTYIVFVGAGSQPQDIEDTSEIDQLGTSLAQTLITKN